MMDHRLMEILQYTREGYSPVVDFGSWRVAVLNYIDELLPQNITKMQKHRDTDEVFVLLKGECLLYIGEGDAEATHIMAQKMEPYKMYNIKQNTWHTHTLSKEAMVLIIENRDTANANSPEIALDEKQRRELIQMAEREGMI